MFIELHLFFEEVTFVSKSPTFPGNEPQCADNEWTLLTLSVGINQEPSSSQDKFKLPAISRGTQTEGQATHTLDGESGQVPTSDEKFRKRLPDPKASNVPNLRLNTNSSFSLQVS
jgi:hypothetical protein